MVLAVAMALGLAAAIAIRLLDVVDELRRSCSRELFRFLLLMFGAVDQSVYMRKGWGRSPYPPEDPPTHSDHHVVRGALLLCVRHRAISVLRRHTRSSSHCRGLCQMVHARSLALPAVEV
jgi:hypothetical protein